MVGGIEFTQADDDTLRSMAKDGHSASEIGKALGRTRNSILGRASRIGVRLSAKSTSTWAPKVFTPEEDKAIRAMAAAGVNARQIALRLGMGRDTVASYALKNYIEIVRGKTGPPPPPPAPPPQPRQRERLVRIAPPPRLVARREEPVQPRMLTFQDLEPDSCRWPIGDPLTAEFRFCGLHASGGPYCTRHTRAATHR